MRKTMAVIFIAALAVGSANANTFDEAFCEQSTAELYPDVDPTEGCSCLADAVADNPDLAKELSPDSEAGDAADSGSADDVATALSDDAIASLKACGYPV